MYKALTPLQRAFSMFQISDQIIMEQPYHWAKAHPQINEVK